MEIKLSRLKQIISEVVEERHASGRMDDIIQSTRGEEVDPHDQALDEMIAEEVEAAMKQFVLDEFEGDVPARAGEPQADSTGKLKGDVQMVINKLAAINTPDELAQLLDVVLDLFSSEEVKKSKMNSDLDKDSQLQHAISLLSGWDIMVNGQSKENKLINSTNLSLEKFNR